jgi:hypothetical protein
MTIQPRGKVTIDAEECKGCGLCVASWPPRCLELAPEWSCSYRPARNIRLLWTGAELMQEGIRVDAATSPHSAYFAFEETSASFDCKRNCEKSPVSSNEPKPTCPHVNVWSITENLGCSSLSTNTWIDPV